MEIYKESVLKLLKNRGVETLEAASTKREKDLSKSFDPWKPEKPFHSDSHFRGPGLADSNFDHAPFRYVFPGEPGWKSAGRKVGKAERQRECRES